MVRKSDWRTADIVELESITVNIIKMLVSFVIQVHMHVVVSWREFSVCFTIPIPSIHIHTGEGDVERCDYEESGPEIPREWLDR